MSKGKKTLSAKAHSLPPAYLHFSGFSPLSGTATEKPTLAIGSSTEKHEYSWGHRNGILLEVFFNKKHCWIPDFLLEPFQI